MNPRVKHAMLGLALFSTIIFVWFAPAADDEGLVLSERVKTTVIPLRDASNTPKNLTNKSSATTATSIPVAVLSIRSRIQSEEIDSQDSRLFTPTQWTIPVTQKISTQQIKPAEKIKPTEMIIKPADEAPAIEAPPSLPFVVLGRYIDAGQEVIFLQNNNQNLVVRVGDTLLGQYKVESLQGTTLNLRYLPLNLAQSLEIGSKQ
jgi:hypothetical protein